MCRKYLLCINILTMFLHFFPNAIKKLCKYCDKEYYKCNFSHHEKTQKHIKNMTKSQSGSEEDE